MIFAADWVFAEGELIPDAGVEVIDEGRPLLGIGEVVPHVGGDAGVGGVRLPLEPLLELQRELVAQRDPRANELAGAVDLRDERRPVAAFVVLAGRSVPAREGADEDPQLDP